MPILSARCARSSPRGKPGGTAGGPEFHTGERFRPAALELRDRLADPITGAVLLIGSRRSSSPLARARVGVAK
jgi:hypothetical protein